MEKQSGEEGIEENKEKAAEMSRKEKRKAMKKLKRKQARKEIAAKEREEEEAKLNDPAEQERLKAIEEEEARIREKELKEFEESERVWREAMELKRKKEEEEEAKREEEEKRWKDLDHSRNLEASGEDDDGEYEYIEEGPPEIIFQGNEIILRKNKVRVPKKSVAEVADRPTSNPLPPETEAFNSHQNVNTAQQILDNVAQEVPNFGTEQDKAHCPFHLKTGACRFGPRCNRVHFYPDKSCTILMKNMYNGPGIAWEQDEGLEVCNRCHLVMLYTDEEAERCYEEFYEDVHTEFLKYGELINFKVCRNGSFHLKGNVYVHYRSLESAILAYQSTNGRYFAGKQVNCEFVNISRWKVAICGEYMKSRLKTCSRGSTCNFLHCFRNSGGDYEWADHDKPPPRFWIHKMSALFGYSDEYLNHTERESSGSLHDVRTDLSSDSHRRPSRRSKSRDHDHVDVGSKTSYRRPKHHDDTRDSTRGHKLSRHEENNHDGDESPSSTRDGSLERGIYKEKRYAKDTSNRESQWSEHSPGHKMKKKRIDDVDSPDGNDVRETSHKHKSSRHYGRRGSVSERWDDEEDKGNRRASSERRSIKDNREGSSADQAESLHEVGDKVKRERSKHGRERSSSRHQGSHFRDNDRKRSAETRVHDSDRRRSRKRERRSSRSGKGESGSGSSSDDKSGREEETHKERLHGHKKRRSQSQEESEEGGGEFERWRPM